jgi:hypothetical protein
VGVVGVVGRVGGGGGGGKKVLFFPPKPIFYKCRVGGRELHSCVFPANSEYRVELSRERDEKEVEKWC